MIPLKMFGATRFRKSRVCSIFSGLKNLNTIVPARANVLTKFKSDYSVEEVKIHVPSENGYLAGKLWYNEKCLTNFKTKSSPPPIVCLHGIQDNCGSFDKLIPLILKDNIIFCIDLPGHGHSYHTKGPHYDLILDGLTSIKQTLRHFGWEKITLLSHSLGSVISFIYSGSFPGEIHKYIAMELLAPFVVRDMANIYQTVVKDQLYEEIRNSIGAERPSFTYDELLQKSFKGRKETVTLEGCKTLLIRGAQKVEGTDRYRFTHDRKANVPATMKMCGEHSNHLKRMVAKGIKCPVCVFKGMPGTDYEPREGFLQMVEILSQTNDKVEFHFVPGTHHFHLNDPYVVAPIINNFLEES